jgi:methionyl-tRNA formyltransferase
MKLIFIGNIKVSLEVLKTINETNKNILAGVVTNNNKKPDSARVDLFCKKFKLPFILSKNINSVKTKKWIKSKKPDIILCVGWSQILKKKVLSIPKKYCIGFHPTRLPANKGKHPIIWSIINDLKNSSTSFFLMNKEIDDGHIISQKNYNIGKKEYVGSVYEKILKNAKTQIKDILLKIKSNKLVIKKIKKKIKSNYWRKRSYNDGKIDFRMGGRSIFNLVRALSYPYPGAHFEYKSKDYKVFNIKYEKNLKENNIEAGKIIDLTKKGFKIKCGDGFVYIKKTIPNVKLKKNTYL